MNPTLWAYLFVTPDAYIRIFDLPYQIESFNTYHKRVLRDKRDQHFQETSAVGVGSCSGNDYRSSLVSRDGCRLPGKIQECSAMELTWGLTTDILPA